MKNQTVSKESRGKLTPGKLYMKFNSYQNSWSVFEMGRKNEFGEPYCVLPLVTRQEAQQAITKAEGR